jgi:hypothetical protein
MTTSRPSGREGARPAFAGIRFSTSSWPIHLISLLFLLLPPSSAYHPVLVSSGPLQLAAVLGYAAWKCRSPLAAQDRPSLPKPRRCSTDHGALLMAAKVAAFLLGHRPTTQHEQLRTTAAFEALGRWVPALGDTQAMAKDSAFAAKVSELAVVAAVAATRRRHSWQTLRTTPPSRTDPSETTSKHMQTVGNESKARAHRWRAEDRTTCLNQACNICTSYRAELRWMTPQEMVGPHQTARDGWSAAKTKACGRT